jgi:hypothetical protein
MLMMNLALPASTTLDATERYPHMREFRRLYAAGLWPTRAEELARREQHARQVPKPVEPASPPPAPKPAAHAAACGGNMLDELRANAKKLAEIGSELNARSVKNYEKVLDRGVARFAAGLTLPKGQKPSALGSGPSAAQFSAAAKSLHGTSRAADDKAIDSKTNLPRGLAKFAAGIKLPCQK